MDIIVPHKSLDLRWFVHNKNMIQLQVEHVDFTEQLRMYSMFLNHGQKLKIFWTIYWQLRILSKYIQIWESSDRNCWDFPVPAENAKRSHYMGNCWPFADLFAWIAVWINVILLWLPIYILYV